MSEPLKLQLDRAAKTSLTEQIHKGIRTAIQGGILPPGARLPSWQDLASQLGVARGTVRIAYEKLSAAQLIVASRATGTRVAERPNKSDQPELPPNSDSFLQTYLEMTAGPAIFQLGVPAQGSFPATLFARIRANAVRLEAAAAPTYPDPRGELELRREIAAYLAMARGIECSASQIVITGGYSSGLGIVLRALGLEQTKVWMEEPGFPFTRRALELARLELCPVPVDGEGMNVDYGITHAPGAKLVVVTPGQQAPLGMTMSLTRRLALIDWATQTGAWIIEDDYLSELQLNGRAAPALASVDRSARVIHIGSFSKTITPTLRLGFIVAPTPLAHRFGEVAACLAPPPGPSTQLAICELMREGHYMRHLRRTKRLYSSQRDALLKCLSGPRREVSVAGLATLLRLPAGTSDVALAREALSFGLAPVPLSVWYSSPELTNTGLLLGIATAPQRHVERAVERLEKVVARLW